MKYKNYKSAIHNFAHSFQSIDYMKSGKLAVNVLINLKNKGIKPIAKFDFINKTIEPVDASSKESVKLLNDYIDWLPDHFLKHNCDINGLEGLQLTIWTDFDKAFSPQEMNNCKQICIQTETKWKAFGKDEEIITISQDELIDNRYLETGLPEM